jgi:hypothetical protein
LKPNILFSVFGGHLPTVPADKALREIEMKQESGLSEAIHSIGEGEGIGRGCLYLNTNCVL